MSNVSVLYTPPTCNIQMTYMGLYVFKILKLHLVENNFHFVNMISASSIVSSRFYEPKFQLQSINTDLNFFTFNFEYVMHDGYCLLCKLNSI